MAVRVDECFIVEEEDARGDLVDLHYFCDRDCAEARSLDEQIDATYHDPTSDRALVAAVRGGAVSERDGHALAYEAWGIQEPDYDVYCAHCESLIFVGRTTLRDVAVDVRVARHHAAEMSHDEDSEDGDDEDRYVDLRVQLLDGGWTLHTGDASYDQDHRGFWGAASVAADATDADCDDIAYAMIREAADAYNESI